MITRGGEVFFLSCNPLAKHEPQKRKDSMTGRRLKEIAANMMIGEGIIGALIPRRYMRLWDFGPKRYRKFIKASAKRPNLVRLASAAEAGLGVWLALRQASR